MTDSISAAYKESEQLQGFGKHYMNFDIYENKLPYPTKPHKPVLKNDATPNEIRLFADRIEQYDKDMDEYSKKHSEYQKEENRLYLLFKKNALENTGLDKHEKADKIFGFAWERSHSGGFSWVYNHLCDLADVLL